VDGAFVIGDLDAVVGKKVTFWGAHWSKKNHFSAGNAPAKFKGWAAHLGGPNPSCGVTWNGDAGKSTAPVTVPSLITAIATSSVTKSGAGMSGDTTMIVVIRTNRDYNARFRDQGTGTVVSITCR